MGYCNEQAYQLACWAQEERIRIKASRIARAAERLERKFCENRDKWQVRSILKHYLPPGPPPGGWC